MGDLAFGVVSRGVQVGLDRSRDVPARRSRLAVDGTAPRGSGLVISWVGLPRSRHRPLRGHTSIPASGEGRDRLVSAEGRRAVLEAAAPWSSRWRGDGLDTGMFRVTAEVYTGGDVAPLPSYEQPPPSAYPPYDQQQQPGGGERVPRR